MTPSAVLGFKDVKGHTRYGMQDARYGMPDVRYEMQDIGYGMQDVR